MNTQIAPSDTNFADFEQDLCREAEKELNLRNIKLANWSCLQTLGLLMDWGAESWDITALYNFGEPLNPDASIRVDGQFVCLWESVAGTLIDIDKVFDGAELPEPLILTGFTYLKGEPTCREDYWGDMQANFAQI